MSDEIISTEYTNANPIKLPLEGRYNAEILPVLVWPNEELHKVAKPVSDFNEELEQTVVNMFATMKYEGGVGLAATQVGIHQRIIVIEIQPELPLVLINPEIVETGEDMYRWQEGCLSVPGYFEYRKRPQKIVLRFNDITGNTKEVEFQGIYSFAIQHEIDHLNGKVFVDGLSTFRQHRVKNKIKKTLRQRTKGL